jgi:hypothetical protein
MQPSPPAHKYREPGIADHRLTFMAKDSVTILQQDQQQTSCNILAKNYYDNDNHTLKRRKSVSELGDKPKKIKLFIEAGSTLGNNAPAVLSQQRKIG